MKLNSNYNLKTKLVLGNMSHRQKSYFPWSPFSLKTNINSNVDK